MIIGFIVVILVATGVITWAMQGAKKPVTGRSFDVNFPGTPKHDVAPGKNGNPDVKLHYVDVGKWRSFGVMHLIFNEKEGPTPESAKAKLIQNVRDDKVKSMSGKLVSEKDIVVQGHPGKEIVIEAEEWIYRAKIIVTPFDLYAVQVTVPKGEGPTSRAIEDFFSSFQLLP